MWEIGGNKTHKTLNNISLALFSDGIIRKSEPADGVG